jgi:hypothetical protein
VKQKQTLNCIYCGQPADTREHIPPKQFFKGVPEESLIVVPSCLICNRGFQKDEDFFRQFWVSMLMDRSPTAGDLMNGQVSRSIQRTPALGWQMFKQMSLVDLVTPTGIYVGKGTAFKITDVDRKRIDRIVVKIIKGLFYNHFQKTIPEDWLIEVYWITPQIEKKLGLQQLAQKLKWNVIKEDTFAYGFDFVPDTHQSMWLMDFFKIPLFYILVLDDETRNAKK